MQKLSMKIIKKIKKKLSYIIFMFPNIIKCKMISTGNYIGNPKFIQPVQINGKGKIKFSENVTIGYDPSPYLYSSYSYIEARNINSKIIIGENVHISNNCRSVIKKKTSSTSQAFQSLLG